MQIFALQPVRDYLLAKWDPEVMAAQGYDQMTLHELLTALRKEHPEEAKAIFHMLMGRLTQNSPAHDAREALREANIRDARRYYDIDLELRELVSGEPSISRSFDNFKVRRAWPGVQEACQAVKAWLLEKEFGLLILSGPPGVGKSHLAVAAAHHLAEAGSVFVYRTESAMIAELQTMMNHGGPEKAIQELCRVPWLIIDELGATSLGEWGKSTMDRLIDARWQAGEWAKTLVTTNLLGEQMPPRIASRLRDKAIGRDILIQADDFRRTQE